MSPLAGCTLGLQILVVVLSFSSLLSKTQRNDLGKAVKLTEKMDCAS